ncbi:unnamed protein product [Schistosoma margrebowiei]|uniref:Uncharacterized protein n=1 Tax=Schistosoma margrebowiei TaxID=48269 RepID=A0A183MZI6_9TREM|nr:unnamed protein product [Schistosoma margrebowiei]
MSPFLSIKFVLHVILDVYCKVVVSSFSCPHCGYENRSLIPASQVQDKGQRITFKANNVKDMNRRVVIPVGSTVSIPEYDSSFPFSDGGYQPDLALKIEKFIDQLRTLLKVDKPFSFVSIAVFYELTSYDPSGNGFIENYLAPNDDPQIEIETYVRTPEQNELLGLQSQPVEPLDDNVTDPNTTQEVSYYFCHICGILSSFNILVDLLLLLLSLLL